MENLLSTTSEDFTNAAWAKTAGGAGAAPIVTKDYAPGPAGFGLACRVQVDLNGGNTLTDQSNLTAASISWPAGQYRGGLYLKATSAGEVGKKIVLRHAGASAYTLITLAADWQRVATLETSTAGGTAAAPLSFGLRGSLGSADSVDFLATGAMLENVTGQSNQNPGEYVSVGAAKLNYLLQSDDVTASPWTTTNTTARASTPIAVDGAILRAYEITATATTLKLQPITGFPATSLVYTIYVKKGSGATDLNTFVVYNSSTATAICVATLNYDTGVLTQTIGSGATAEDRGNGVWKLTFPVSSGISVGNNLYFYAGCAGSSETAGEWAYFGGASVVPGTTPPSTHFPVGNVYPFHGACVDGVKYFEYQNGNTVASNVVTEAMGAPLTTCKGQLVETASTNRVYPSSIATWSPNGTPTVVAAAKYCGSVPLDLVGDDDAAVTERFANIVSFTGDGSKSVSLLVAQGSAANTFIQLAGLADRLAAVITWSGGAPTVSFSVGSQERPPKALQNGVYRLFLLASGVIAAETNTIRIAPGATSLADSAGTGTIYIGGVQAENATTASSLIPTTTGAVTRKADAGSYPAAGNVSASGGTLYVEYEIERDSPVAQILAEVGDTTVNERITLYRSLAGNLTLDVLDGGVTQASLTLGAAAVGTSGKVAVRWAANDIAGVMTGGAVQTDASATLPAVTTIYPANGRGTAQANVPTKNLRISQTTLTNAELQLLIR